MYLPRQITQPVLKFLGRAMFFSMGFTVTVKGRIASPVEAPIFVVAPHSTFFDGIACVVAGLPSMVSRNENVQVPLIGSKYLEGAIDKPFLCSLHLKHPS